MAITYAKEVVGFDGQVSTYDATRNGRNVSIPKNTCNRDYLEMLETVDAGDLIITPAE